LKLGALAACFPQPKQKFAAALKVSSCVFGLHSGVIRMTSRFETLVGEDVVRKI
jgi:hypothetical protein